MAEHKLNLFPPNVQPEREPSNVSQDRRERELERISGTGKPKTMTIPLGVMVPLLMKAAESNHTWLEDFEDDVIQIDADLHEVLMAFQNLPHSKRDAA